MARVVYAKVGPCFANDGGLRVLLSPGDVWDADAPLVKAHPEWFVGEPVVARGAGGVEQATAAPGEQRASRAR